MAYQTIPPSGMEDVIATASGDVTNLTVTGLNGDLDGDYEYQAVIIYKGAGAVTYMLRPFLTDESNLRTLFNYNAGTANTWQAQGSGAPTTGWFTSTENAAGDHKIVMRGTITSKTGRMRFWNGLMTSTRTSSSVVSALIYGWSLDDVTNITELTINASVASRIGAGSYLKVRKLKSTL